MKVPNYFVTFQLGENIYGIDINSVVEIINMVALTPVPSVHQSNKKRKVIAGLVNLRGKVIPVLNMRTLFDMTEDEYTVSTRIIIVKANTDSFGLIVDSVIDVEEVNSEYLDAIDTKDSESDYEFLSGIYRNNENLILLIDIEKTLNRQQFRIIRQLTEQKKKEALTP